MWRRRRHGQRPRGRAVVGRCGRGDGGGKSAELRSALCTDPGLLAEILVLPALSLPGRRLLPVRHAVLAGLGPQHLHRLCLGRRRLDGGRLLGPMGTMQLAKNAAKNVHVLLCELASGRGIDGRRRLGRHGRAGGELAGGRGIDGGRRLGRHGRAGGGHGALADSRRGLRGVGVGGCVQRGSWM